MQIMESFPVPRCYFDDCCPVAPVSEVDKGLEVHFRVRTLVSGRTLFRNSIDGAKVAPLNCMNHILDKEI